MNLQHFLTAFGRISAQAGVVVLIILAAQWIFRRQLAPRWRCALWLVLVVRLLVPFSSSSALSIFNVLNLAATKASAAAAPVAESEEVPAPQFSVQQQMSTAADSILATMERFSPPAAPGATETGGWRSLAASWPLALAGLWLAGAGALLGRLVVTSRRFARSLAAAVPVTDPAVLGLLQACCDRLGIASRPILLETEAVGSPALYGFLRPQLLLPAGLWRRLASNELRFVVLHELAHLKRRDLPLNWLMAALQVAHWFNPLVWLGFARWRADRELACDALTLEAAEPDQAKAYGETILRLLQEVASPAMAPGAVGILEEAGQLRHRIRMIAGFRPRSRWSALGLLLVAVVAISSLTDAREQDDRNQSPPASPLAPASAPAVNAPAAPPNAGIRVYRLSIHDRIQIAVFREPTLDVSQSIDPRGNLSLALIGDIHVAGLSLGEARKAVEDAYRKSGALHDPVGVSMTIEQYSPHAVSIQGAVKNPGRFEMYPDIPLSVVTLLTKAGGVTDVGKGNDVRITHQNAPRGSRIVTHVDVESIIEGRSSLSPDDPSLMLADGDIVYVPERLISDPEHPAPPAQR